MPNKVINDITNLICDNLGLEISDATSKILMNINEHNLIPYYPIDILKINTDELKNNTNYINFIYNTLFNINLNILHYILNLTPETIINRMYIMDILNNFSINTKSKNPLQTYFKSKHVSPLTSEMINKRLIVSDSEFEYLYGLKNKFEIPVFIYHPSDMMIKYVNKIYSDKLDNILNNTILSFLQILSYTITDDDKIKEYIKYLQNTDEITMNKKKNFYEYYNTINDKILTEVNYLKNNIDNIKFTSSINDVESGVTLTNKYMLDNFLNTMSNKIKKFNIDDYNINIDNTLYNLIILTYIYDHLHNKLNNKNIYTYINELILDNNKIMKFNNINELIKLYHNNTTESDDSTFINIIEYIKNYINKETIIEIFKLENLTNFTKIDTIKEFDLFYKGIPYKNYYEINPIEKSLLNKCFYIFCKFKYEDDIYFTQLNNYIINEFDIKNITDICLFPKLINTKLTLFNLFKNIKIVLNKFDKSNENINIKNLITTKDISLGLNTEGYHKFFNILQKPNLDPKEILILYLNIYNKYSGDDKITPDTSIEHFNLVITLLTKFGIEYNLINSNNLTSIEIKNIINKDVFIKKFCNDLKIKDNSPILKILNILYNFIKNVKNMKWKNGISLAGFDVDYEKNIFRENLNILLEKNELTYNNIINNIPSYVFDLSKIMKNLNYKDLNNNIEAGDINDAEITNILSDTWDNLDSSINSEENLKKTTNEFTIMFSNEFNKPIYDSHPIICNSTDLETLEKRKKIKIAKNEIDKVSIAYKPNLALILKSLGSLYRNNIKLPENITEVITKSISNILKINQDVYLLTLTLMTVDIYTKMLKENIPYYSNNDVKLPESLFKKIQFLLNKQIKNAKIIFDNRYEEIKKSMSSLLNISDNNELFPVIEFNIFD